MGSTLKSEIRSWRGQGRGVWELADDTGQRRLGFP